MRDRSHPAGPKQRPARAESRPAEAIQRTSAATLRRLRIRCWRSDNEADPVRGAARWPRERQARRLARGRRRVRTLNRKQEQPTRRRHRVMKDRYGKVVSQSERARSRPRGGGWPGAISLDIERDQGLLKPRLELSDAICEIVVARGALQLFEHGWNRVRRHRPIPETDAGEQPQRRDSQEGGRDQQPRFTGYARSVRTAIPSRSQSGSGTGRPAITCQRGTLEAFAASTRAASSDA